jgi:hypothetical protein
LADQRTTEIVHDDLRAACGQFESVLPAESLPGTGDDRHPSVEPQFRHVHVLLLSVVRLSFHHRTRFRSLPG